MITDARLFNVVETTDVAAIRVLVELAQTATTIGSLMGLTIGQASSVIEVPLSVIEVRFMKVRMAMVVTAVVEEATTAATTVDRATIAIETSTMGTTEGNRTKGETRVHSQETISITEGAMTSQTTKATPIKHLAGCLTKEMRDLGVTLTAAELHITTDHVQVTTIAVSLEVVAPVTCLTIEADRDSLIIINRTTTKIEPQDGVRIMMIQVDPSMARPVHPAARHMNRKITTMDLMIFSISEGGMTAIIITVVMDNTVALKMTALNLTETPLITTKILDVAAKSTNDADLSIKATIGATTRLAIAIPTDETARWTTTLPIGAGRILLTLERVESIVAAVEVAKEIDKAIVNQCMTRIEDAHQ